MSSSNVELWSSLDLELGSLLDHFTNLVRASRIQTEDDTHGVLSSTGARGQRGPGDMLQLWVEKIIHSGHTSLHILSQLKKGAITGDFDLLLGHVRVARKELEASIVESDKQISELKKEIRELGARRDVLQTGARMET